MDTNVNRRKRKIKETTKTLSKVNYLKYLVDNTSIPALQSYYGTRFKEVKKANKVEPVLRNERTHRCLHCLVHHSLGPSHIYIEKLRRSERYERKLYNKIVKEKPLTKAQRKFVKRNQYPGDNCHVVECLFCHKKKKTLMSKPASTDNFVSNVVCTSAPNTIKKAMRKKAKRKDRTCGLNESAVLSVQKFNHSTPKIKQEHTSDNEMEVVIPNENSNSSITMNPPLVKRLFMLTSNRNENTDTANKKQRRKKGKQRKVKSKKALKRITSIPKSIEHMSRADKKKLNENINKLNNMLKTPNIANISNKLSSFINSL